MSDAYIIDALRTPRGKGKKRGSLANIHPQELAATLLKEIPKRVKIDPEIVDDVVLGCVTQVNDQAACIARYAVMAAEWPNSVPGYTVNRFCGSGLQAVNNAFAQAKADSMDVVVAGGVESMSRVKMGTDIEADQMDFMAASNVGNSHISEIYNLVPQGISADLIATKYNISREDVDHFAEQSQQRAKNAIDNNYFKQAIVPVLDSAGNFIEADEHPRIKSDFKFLSGLPAAFKTIGEQQLDQIALKSYPDVKNINHVHTLGNSSGVVDGAGLVLIANDNALKRHGLKPRAKVLAMATSGEDPTIMLTGPVSASKKALAKANLNAQDIDLWEINEAFAAVVLYVQQQLDIDPTKINVNGGAIALGHPLGGTGAIILGTLVDELERQNKRYGLATLCIGGGMGITTIIERI